MNFPESLLYTKTHEWISKNGNIAKIGITDYAQKEISDVVFVELPKVDQQLEKAKPSSVVESVKAAFDIYAPLSGKVLKINDALESNPGLVNQDPYGDGWFFEIELSNETELNELLPADQYSAVISEKKA